DERRGGGHPEERRAWSPAPAHRVRVATACRHGAQAYSTQTRPTGRRGRSVIPTAWGHARGSGDDPVHLEHLRELAVHIRAVHLREVPDVLGVGVPPMLL